MDHNKLKAPPRWLLRMMMVHYSRTLVDLSPKDKTTYATQRTAYRWRNPAKEN